MDVLTDHEQNWCRSDYIKHMEAEDCDKRVLIFSGELHKH